MSCVVSIPAWPLTLGSLRRWYPKALLSVADQGLASGGHFALNILLIRALTPAEYGAFAVAFAIFLFASGLHSALILEPMGVLGPTRYQGRLPEYLGRIVWMHGGLSLPVAAILLLVAAGMAAAQSPLAPAMSGMSLSAPLILLFWLFRRACYLETRPDLASQGSLLYLLLLLAGTAVMWRLNRLSAAGAFLVMGAAGLAVSLLFWRRLRGRATRDFPPPPGEVVRHHWAYARWSLGTTVLHWLASLIYLPLVGALAGLREVAAFRATENLLLPMSQVLTAASLLLLPLLSGRLRAQGHSYLRATAGKLALVAGSAAGVYGLGILTFGGGLVRLLYGGDYYASYSQLVNCLAAALVLRAVGDTGFGVAAKAAGWPDIEFWATAAGAAVTLTAGVGLVSRYGAAGAAAGWTASSAASCLVSIGIFRSRLK